MFILKKYTLYLITLLFLGMPTVLLSLEYECLEYPPENATLSDYLIIAASNNQELVSAFDQWKAALEVILEVDVLPDPDFTFRYFIVPIETRAGPVKSSYALTQTFPWMGKLRLKGEIAEQEALVLKTQFDQLLLDVLLNVKKTYYEYTYLCKSIIVTKEVLDILVYVDEVARNGYSASNVLFADVIRAQVELGIVEDRLRSLEDLRKPIVAKLNAAMNLPVNNPLPMPCSIPVLEIPCPDDSLAFSLKENNPRLVGFDFLARSEEVAIRLAKKEFYPDFTFGIETDRIGSARSPGIFNSGNAPWIATVSINIPLWQQNRRAAVRKARKRRGSAMEGRRGLEENLSADLELALYKYRDAKRKVDLYGRTLVPKSKESLAVILDAFVTERSNFIDLIDTERTLLELELAYERSLTDQAIYFSEVEALTAQEWQVDVDIQNLNICDRR
ncbi:MAG: hypothetical protein K1000chlam2_00947 [Chlamydiae bacterium]|nr:hypothetical protein [Chlamydiota bacterium]